MAQFIPVTDFADPALDVYARATENQLLNRADPTEALFIAESPLVIGRALDTVSTRRTVCLSLKAYRSLNLRFFRAMNPCRC